MGPTAWHALLIARLLPPTFLRLFLSWDWELFHLRIFSKNLPLVTRNPSKHHQLHLISRKFRFFRRKFDWFDRNSVGDHGFRRRNRFRLVERGEQVASLAGSDLPRPRRIIRLRRSRGSGNISPIRARKFDFCIFFPFFSLLWIVRVLESELDSSLFLFRSLGIEFCCIRNLWKCLQRIGKDEKLKIIFCFLLIAWKIALNQLEF